MYHLTVCEEALPVRPRTPPGHLLSALGMRWPCSQPAAALPLIHWVQCPLTRPQAFLQGPPVSLPPRLCSLSPASFLVDWKWANPRTVSWEHASSFHLPTPSSLEHSSLKELTVLVPSFSTTPGNEHSDSDSRSLAESCRTPRFLPGFFCSTCCLGDSSVLCVSVLCSILLLNRIPRCSLEPTSGSSSPFGVCFSIVPYL